jgi:hypothetical protein
MRQSTDKGAIHLCPAYKSYKPKQMIDRSDPSQTRRRLLSRQTFVLFPPLESRVRHTFCFRASFSGYLDHPLWLISWECGAVSRTSKTRSLELVSLLHLVSVHRWLKRQTQAANERLPPPTLGPTAMPRDSKEPAGNVVKMRNNTKLCTGPRRN